MKVVILCGGLGTRLREETEFRPKPMVEIGGRPILWHIMKIYAHYNFTNFVLCLGYKGESIRHYFLNLRALESDFTIRLGHPPRLKYHRSNSREDWTVTLADTGFAAMTGARVKRVEKYIDGDEFMLTYGDGVADIDVRKLVDFHRRHGKIGTVTGVRPPSRFGELRSDGSTVVEFSEKPLVSQGFINGGFFVFQRRFLEYLSDEDHCILERGPLERLARDGQLALYSHTGFWQCIDTYRDLQLLNDLWSRGSHPWKVW